MRKSLILASTSAYKKALLSRLQLPFDALDPKVDEAFAPDESASALAERLAREKALSGSYRIPRALVIGADQVASLHGRPFGKPLSREAAMAQLRASSGNSVIFHTAVALAEDGALLEQRTMTTEVVFRDLSDREVERYVSREPALDCAGSFRWESLGITLFSALRGDDPTALEGLPLIALTTMLMNAGLSPL